MGENPEILAESGVDGLPHIVMMILTDTEGDIYITRSLWALRARLLVGGPSGRLLAIRAGFWPFGPANTITHYQTANKLSNG